MPIPSADLTAEHFRAHSDGDLYWFISHGFTTPDGAATAMPGFSGTLSSEAIWDLIDYLHVYYPGQLPRRTGSWPRPLLLPQFDAQCANGRIIDRDDTQGHALRVVAVSDEEQIELPSLDHVDAITIIVTPGKAPRPVLGACIALEPQLWAALAIIIGLHPDTLQGTQMLVDPNGWLRAVWRPGSAEDSNNPNVLSTPLRSIIAHPLVVKSTGAHVHTH